MENLLQVAQIILLFSLSALAIYLVIVLFNFKKSISEFSKNFNDITVKLIPVLENLDALTTKVSKISDTIDEQLSILKSSVESIKNVTDNVASFEKKIQAEIESPILELVGFFAGVIKKVSQFFKGAK